MKQMFELSLNRTYELLQEQLVQARRTGKVQVKVCASLHPNFMHGSRARLFSLKLARLNGTLCFVITFTDICSMYSW